MRMAVLADRSCLIEGTTAVDVAEASDGLFAPDIMDLYERWPEFSAWAAKRQVVETADPVTDAATALSRVAADTVGAPSPRPRQIFAIGLNYADHAAETNTPAPESPPTFTKFVSCLAGPFSSVTLSSDAVDYEVELVVVIGRPASHVPQSAAWDVVAGVTVGQDFSDRPVQTAGPMPQFSLGKSFPGYGPTGPVLVTPDELPDPDDLSLSCTVSGESMQDSRTSNMIFSVPELIARLSAVTPLLPGDLIFTGTPSGVGMARRPQRFLRNGDDVISTIEGIGSLHTRCVAR